MQNSFLRSWWPTSRGKSFRSVPSFHPANVPPHSASTYAVGLTGWGVHATGALASRSFRFHSTVGLIAAASSEKTVAR